MSTRQSRTDYIEDLCEQHGCREKITKIHMAQYVDRNWHPHPPAGFEIWWRTQQGAKEGIDAQRAFNCQVYRNAFLEAKQYGVVASA